MGANGSNGMIAILHSAAFSEIAHVCAAVLVDLHTYYQKCWSYLTCLLRRSFDQLVILNKEYSRGVEFCRRAWLKGNDLDRV